MQQEAVASCIDYNIGNSYGREGENGAKLGNEFPFRSCCVRDLIDTVI